MAQMTGPITSTLIRIMVHTWAQNTPDQSPARRSGSWSTPGHRTHRIHHQHADQDHGPHLGTEHTGFITSTEIRIMVHTWTQNTPDQSPARRSGSWSTPGHRTHRTNHQHGDQDHGPHLGTEHTGFITSTEIRIMVHTWAQNTPDSSPARRSGSWSTLGHRTHRTNHQHGDSGVFTGRAL